VKFERKLTLFGHACGMNKRLINADVKAWWNRMFAVPLGHCTRQRTVVVITGAVVDTHGLRTMDYTRIAQKTAPEVTIRVGWGVKLL